MLYIIQILAVILIGTSIATVISRRNTVLLLGCLVAIGFALATLITPAWWSLWAGTAAFLIGQIVQRDPRPA